MLVKSNSHVVLKSPTEGKGYWLELLLGKINAKVQKRLGNAPSFPYGDADCGHHRTRNALRRRCR